MPSVGFELTISASEWPQTHALDRAATGTGFVYVSYFYFFPELDVQQYSHKFIILLLSV